MLRGEFSGSALPVTDAVHTGRVVIELDVDGVIIDQLSLKR